MAHAVLDIGKTLAKITLWSDDGTLLVRETRANQSIDIASLRRLDVEGIDNWLGVTLKKLVRDHRIETIFPVGHGAAAAIISDGKLVTAPIDYEQDYDPNERARYNMLRDSFASTGSPALPNGLNLGMQLYHLTNSNPDILNNASILPWPQYWAWRLSGVMANEVTSMGCHSDLWSPANGEASALANKMGWSDHFAPLRSATSVLGTVTTEWLERAELSPGTKVYCGIHDSNAALIAARAFPEIIERESTVLSTGTWFIAMRSPETADQVDIGKLPEGYDCIVNVDAFGKPVPSARFMGGREIETQIEIDTRRVDIKPDQPNLLSAVPYVVANNSMLLPTMAPGTGPFPNSNGAWINRPDDWFARRAAVCLYAALVADQSLDLIGSCERVLIEGRFSEAEVFVRALANLRPDSIIYVSNAHNDVAIGALRLINQNFAPAGQLVEIKPLESDLSVYKARWHAEVDGKKAAA